MKGIWVPDDREEASSFRVFTGKARCSKRAKSSAPTAPVAPKTATFNPFTTAVLPFSLNVPKQAYPLMVASVSHCSAALNPIFSPNRGLPLEYAY